MQVIMLKILLILQLGINKDTLKFQSLDKFDINVYLLILIYKIDVWIY